MVWVKLNRVNDDVRQIKCGARIDVCTLHTASLSLLSLLGLHWSVICIILPVSHKMGDISGVMMLPNLLLTEEATG